MTYIPEKYKKYDVLPYCREHGGEAFSYPSALLDRITAFLPDGETLMPYGYDSMEEYLADVEKAKAQYAENDSVIALFDLYKERMLDMNNKEWWSVLKYKGPRIGEVTGLIPGHTYFWPTSKTNPVFEGVIDEEEFTSYLFPTNEEYWEILEDPTGMAERTIQGGKGSCPKKRWDHLMAQVEDLFKNEEK